MNQLLTQQEVAQTPTGSLVLLRFVKQINNLLASYPSFGSWEELNTFNRLGEALDVVKVRDVSGILT